MRKKFTLKHFPSRLFALIIFLAISHSTNIKAQALAGNYHVTGYFFSPASVGGPVNMIKSLSQTSANTYTGDFATIGSHGWKFSFSIDGSNHLTNWSLWADTAFVQSSGFMTQDNPGQVDYSVDDSANGALPGQGEYLSGIFNNTYDPATQTFYMHYGYVGGGTIPNQVTYTRQVYEKWELDVLRVTSFTPAAAKTGDTVLINGRHFTGTTGVSFGGVAASSFWVLSDSVIIALVGGGATGAVSVTTLSGSASKDGFFYNIAVGGPDSIKTRSNTPVTYSVPAITGAEYEWTVPYGDSVVAGQHTNKVSVLWGLRPGVISAKIIKNGNSITVSKVVRVSTAFNVIPGIQRTITVLTASVYPNPAVSTASLQVSGYAGKLAVVVTDVNGHQVKNAAITMGNSVGSYLISVANLKPGIYFVSIKDANGVKTIKLVKTR